MPATPMRIALFNWRDLAHPRAGGAERYTHDLLAGLSARGHDCTWVAASVPGHPAMETNAGYAIVRLGGQVSCRFSAAAWLAERKEKIDVAIDEVNTLPFFSPFILGDAAIALIHQLARELWFVEAPRIIAPLGYVAEPFALQIYRRSTIVTISRSSQASLKSVGLRGPMHIIECPLEDPSPGPTQPQAQLIGYVGRLTPSKRVDHAIDALSALTKEFPEAQLIIVGDGNPREQQHLRAHAIRRGVDDRITFTGRVDRKARDEIFARLAVHVLPSMREGWGLVVSEAARFGVPSVGYNVPGLSDSIVSGDTGLLANTQSPAELAECIARILRDRALRDRLGENARAYITRFTMERFLDRFENLLHEKMQQRRAARSKH